MRLLHPEEKQGKEKREKEIGNMTATKEEVQRIIDWCENKKKERGRIHIIERNPFAEEILWTRRFPLIEIDKAKEVAAKTSLVYDSTTKRLWHYLNGNWRMYSSE